MSMGSSSTMEKLLKAWGLNFDGDEGRGRSRLRRPHAAKGKQPAVLALTETAINRDDVITADADNLFFVFAGAFTGTPVGGLEGDGAPAFVEELAAHRRDERAVWRRETDAGFRPFQHRVPARRAAHGQVQDGVPRGQTEGRGEAAGARRKAGGEEARSARRAGPEGVEGRDLGRALRRLRFHPGSTGRAGSGEPVWRAAHGHSREWQPRAWRRARSSNSPATTTSSRSAAAPRASGSSRS